MVNLVYDGENAIFGRMATVVAKELLRGNSVKVINCEKILISGEKKNFVKEIIRKRKMGTGGSMKGPTYIRRADMLVKRMIRGMLPWDRGKGREAFERLMCYTSTNGVTDQEITSAKKFSHQIPAKNSSIKDIIELLK